MTSNLPQHCSPLVKSNRKAEETYLYHVVIGAQDPTFKLDGGLHGEQDTNRLYRRALAGSSTIYTSPMLQPPHCTVKSSLTWDGGTYNTPAPRIATIPIFLKVGSWMR